MRAAAIINPQSGGGRTIRVWRELGDQLARELPGLSIHFTERPQHAVSLAREIATKDFDRLVVVGGDGTLHEVINGLFDRGKPLFKTGFSVGILNGGRGCDFSKSVGLAVTPQKMLSAAVGCKTLRIDVGRVELGIGTKYYLNSCTIGLGGEVAKAVQAGSSLLPPAASYFASLLGSVASAQAKKMKVLVDGHLIHEGQTHNVFVCNGRYSGGGMLWAPKAQLNDGLLDILLVRDMSRLTLLTLAPRVYSGTLSTVPGVSLYTAQTSEVSCDTETLIELDGEVYSTQVARFEVLPKALSLLVL